MNKEGSDGCSHGCGCVLLVVLCLLFQEFVSGALEREASISDCVDFTYIFVISSYYGDDMSDAPYETKYKMFESCVRLNLNKNMNVTNAREILSAAKRGEPWAMEHISKMGQKETAPAP